LWEKNWVVYAKRPFGSPQTVLDYLGRYIHRVALSNDRILQVENAEVTLSYRDRRDDDRKKTMTLQAGEFIRRFLLHILPDGFMRVRHFGFLANRSKKQALARCRNLLNIDPSLPRRPDESTQDLLLKITGSILVAARAATRERWLLSATYRPRRSRHGWILHEQQSSLPSELMELSICRLGEGVSGATPNCSSSRMAASPP
jgi:Putative transposase